MKQSFIYTLKVWLLTLLGIPVLLTLIGLIADQEFELLESLQLTGYVSLFLSVSIILFFFIVLLLRKMTKPKRAKLVLSVATLPLTLFPLFLLFGMSLGILGPEVLLAYVLAPILCVIIFPFPLKTRVVAAAVELQTT